MIFLSLGTHEQPFERAVDLTLAPALAAHGEPIVVQHGHTPPRTGTPGTTWHHYMDYADMVRTMKDARAFVCHAGVGSVLTALTHGVTPVVIPRRHALGEHVDDHQLDFSEALAARGLIVALLAGDADLAGAVQRAATMSRTPRGPGRELTEAVRAAALAT